MAVIDADMRRVVDEQRLGFVATVNADGTPNLSPKGAIRVWDDDRLLFADVRSPNTVNNLEARPVTEINVVDPVSRTGYRFRGQAEVLRSGPEFDRALAHLRDRGVESRIEALIVVRVEQASALTSPAYDSGATEDEIRERWLARITSKPRS